MQNDKVGLVGELNKLFSLRSSTLHLVGAGVLGYAVLEGVEAFGLWWQKRWAEYLTLIATALFLPLEVYEIIHKGSPLKVIALIVNLAVVVYLLFAKRLFGIRGGAAAEHAARERDMGWDALERATPWLAQPEPDALPSRSRRARDGGLGSGRRPGGPSRTLSIWKTNRPPQFPIASDRKHPPPAAETNPLSAAGPSAGSALRSRRPAAAA